MQHRADFFPAAVFILALGLGGLAAPFPAIAQEREGARAAYISTILASNKPGIATTVDSSLVDPWGMTKSRSGPLWIANEGRGRITQYSGAGIPVPALSPFVLVLPPSPGGIYDDASPTGIVLNDTNDFELEPGAPARILVVTRDDAIMGWSGNYGDSPDLLVDNSPDAIYTGAAIGRYQHQNVLYTANLGQGRVEVYDGSFTYLSLKDGAFTDPLIPPGYGPYNIQSLSGYVIVAYAELDDLKRDAAPADGAGYVDVFDGDGNLVLRLEHGPWLNAPWGIAEAPPEFGRYGGALLIGNNGNGTIAGFDRGSGRFLGYLSDDAGSPLVVPGLHALSFGNNAVAGPLSTLFFSAGFHTPRQGMFGAITFGRPSSPGPLY